jgi:hypothetical protein
MLWMRIHGRVEEGGGVNFGEAWQERYRFEDSDALV